MPRNDVMYEESSSMQIPRYNEKRVYIYSDGPILIVLYNYFLARTLLYQLCVAKKSICTDVESINKDIHSNRNDGLPFLIFKCR